MNKVIEIIGNRLRLKRTELQLTQEQVAEKANLHPTYIGQIERGEKNATIDSLFKICVALNYPMEELFEKIVEYNHESSNIPMECYLIISNQTKKDQKSILSIIKSIQSIKES